MPPTYSLLTLLLNLLPFALIFLKNSGLLTKKTPESDFSKQTRLGMYQQLVRGRQSESVEFLADSAGVSYKTALAELKKSIADGDFGPGAYLDYYRKALVLPDYGGDAGGLRESPAEPADSFHVNLEPQPQPQGMIAAGILLLAVGVFLVSTGLSGAVSALFPSPWVRVLNGALFLAGGGAALILRLLLNRREARFRVYASLLKGKGKIQLAELASGSGQSVATLRRDIRLMTDRGMLSPFSRLDEASGTLILDPAAARSVSGDFRDYREEDYRGVLAEIEQLNREIAEPGISDRIQSIEEITEKIFRAVLDDPEKQPRIKSFLSYYLPTTVKLLRSYAALEKSGAVGENVSGAKKSIAEILTRLNTGFLRQLDKLYEPDALDISVEIEVLDDMMARDGLSGEKNVQIQAGAGADSHTAGSRLQS